jgi:hypothetical protein
MLSIGNIHINFTNTDKGMLVSLRRHGIECKGLFSISFEDPLSRFFHQVFDTNRTVNSAWLSECQDLSFQFTPASENKDAIIRGSLCIDVDDEHGAFEVSFAYNIQLEDITVDFKALDRVFDTYTN